MRVDYFANRQTLDTRLSDITSEVILRCILNLVYSNLKYCEGEVKRTEKAAAAQMEPKGRSNRRQQEQGKN